MKVSRFSLSSSIAGAFIGAGFISGQELWQFFGKYGIWGIVGCILAVSCIILLSALTIYYVSKSNRYSFEQVINFTNNKFFKRVLIVFEILFYLCIYVIMIAGTESLVSSYINISPALIGVVFCTAVTLVSISGTKAVVSSFSITIPILVIITVAISIYVIATNGLSIPKVAIRNTVLSNWLVSALIYVSYNFVGGIGVFASLKQKISMSDLAVSSSIAFVFLAALGLPILLSVFSTESQNADMPMLAVANRASVYLGYVYSVLLVLAMFGASIASIFPITELIKNRLPKKIKYVSISFALSAICILFSLFGFTNLINSIYPAFGYAGFGIITVLIINFIRFYKKRS